jgi:hypothetical protein
VRGHVGGAQPSQHDHDQGLPSYAADMIMTRGCIIKMTGCLRAPLLRSHLAAPPCRFFRHLDNFLVSHKSTLAY